MPPPRRPQARSDTREERKYPIADARAAMFRAWLSVRLQPDPQYPSGVITSCYFDTPSLEAYWDSADGQLAKHKLRLRWYGDPIDSFAGAWLELKSRDGAVSFKQRVRFASQGRELGEGIFLPDREALTEVARRLDPSVPATLEPTALVRYRRERWRDRASGLRVSLDSNVRIAPPRPGPAWRPLPRGAVLELKSTGPLPPRLRGLRRFGLNRTAHSKYALAVEQLLGGVRARTA